MSIPAIVRFRSALSIVIIAMVLIMQSNNSSRSAEEKLSLPEATALYARSPFLQDKSSIGPAPELRLSEERSEEIWKQMHAQLFRVDKRRQDGELLSSGEYVLIHDKNIFQLVPPAMPVIQYQPPNMVLADIDHDGRAELFFCYSWGIGIFYSTASVLFQDGARLVPGGKLTYRLGNLSLRKQDEQNVCVLLDGKKMLGRFVCDSHRCYFKLDEGLPADIRRHITGM